MTFTQTTVFGILFLFLTSALGSACVYFFSVGISKKFHILFLGFTAGVMTAASIWSLLLPALSEAEVSWGQLAFIPVAIGFLLGGLLIVLVEKWLHLPSKGDVNVYSFSS